MKTRVSVALLSRDLGDLGVILARGGQKSSAILVVFPLRA